MNSPDQFITIGGKRYRKPRPMIRPREEQDRLDDIGLQLHEVLHKTASLLSQLEGWGRDQRYSYSIPQALFELLGRTDEGASVVASKAFLETLGYRVEEIKK